MSKLRILTLEELGAVQAMVGSMTLDPAPTIGLLLAEYVDVISVSYVAD